MKTGLVTFYHIHHYGACLQALATERAVEALGHECEILDYYVNQDNALFRRPTGPAALAADAHTTLHYQALKRRQQRFDAFQARELRLTAHRYRSFEELKSASLPYDVYLSGSDQIWNPTIFPDHRFDPVFFSAFTAGRKIAYAPSFGVPRIPDGMEDELRSYLAPFSHIAVRETQGQTILRELTGQTVPVVLDPTLLLRREDWSAIAQDPGLSGGYILCYCISRPDALVPYIETLARETGLPVVQLCGIRRPVVPGAKLVLDAGPAEFLGLFRGASFVCTNSFHGTVFSVQFGKPFFTAAAPSERKAPELSRTYSLLSRLGLESRIIGKGDSARTQDPIVWPAVQEKLEHARRDSLAYLRCALENRPYQPEEGEKPPVPQLAERSRCTGCGACAAVCPRDAIAMRRDREGFDVPVVDREKCIQCGRCSAACPILHPRTPDGVLPAAYAAWVKDDAVRLASTSGGVFTALAEDTLRSGGVVFGAAFDDALHLRHTAAFRAEDLAKFRGAKYVQSDLGSTFREIREVLKTRPVLFSGTPCQVDGLYRFLGSRPENLTTCDLVCHGVPSPGVWESFVADQAQRKRKAIASVRFRAKTEGWQKSYLTLRYEDGSQDSAPLYETEYGRAFGRSLFLRESCFRCPYSSLSRVGDLTLGDFWGLRPEELAEQQEKGVSLLLINTPHGSHVFDRLSIGCKQYPAERAVAGNPRLASPTAYCPERAAFFAAYALEPFAQVRKKFLTLPPYLVRAASKALTPELKAKVKRVLKR